MTPRELAALREVWLDAIERQSYMHASIQATLYNAHFDTKGVPWTAEDLMGRGDRAKRQQQRLIDRAQGAKMAGFAIGPVDETGMAEFAKQLAANRKLVN